MSATTIAGHWGLHTNGSFFGGGKLAAVGRWHFYVDDNAERESACHNYKHPLFIITRTADDAAFELCPRCIEALRDLGVTTRPPFQKEQDAIEEQHLTELLGSLDGLDIEAARDVARSPELVAAVRAGQMTVGQAALVLYWRSEPTITELRAELKAARAAKTADAAFDLEWLPKVIAERRAAK